MCSDLDSIDKGKDCDLVVGATCNKGEDWTVGERDKKRRTKHWKIIIFKWNIVYNRKSDMAFWKVKGQNIENKFLFSSKTAIIWAP